MSLFAGVNLLQVNQRFELFSEAAHVLRHSVLACWSQHAELYQVGQGQTLRVLCIPRYEDAGQLGHHHFHGPFAKNVPRGHKLVVHAKTHLIEELWEAVGGGHIHTVAHQGVATLVAYFRLAQVAQVPRRRGVRQGAPGAQNERIPLLALQEVNQFVVNESLRFHVVTQASKTMQETFQGLI